jgi:hypothetical protein
MENSGSVIPVPVQTPALVCQGAGRDAEGHIIHALGCPVLIRDGDKAQPSHGLSEACLPAYLRWVKNGAL